MNTPTPWKLDDGELWRIIGADGKPVFSRTRTNKDNLTVEQSEANRDRILECVNALAGIASPAEFRAAVEELRAAWNNERSSSVARDENQVHRATSRLLTLLPAVTGDGK